MDINKKKMELENLVMEHDMEKEYYAAIHYCNKILEMDELDIHCRFSKAVLLYKNKDYLKSLTQFTLLDDYDKEGFYREDTEKMVKENFSRLLELRAI